MTRVETVSRWECLATRWNRSPLKSFKLPIGFVELYSLQNGGHADEMLIAYLPTEKIVIEADEFTAGPETAAATSVANPYAAALVDNLERLKLDYEIVLGLHGRQAAKKELLQAAGKLKLAARRRL